MNNDEQDLLKIAYAVGIYQPQEQDPHTKARRVVKTAGKLATDALTAAWFVSSPIFMLALHDAAVGM